MAYPGRDLKLEKKFDKFGCGELSKLLLAGRDRDSDCLRWPPTNVTNILTLAD
jgi:hypothetical protein